MDFLPSVIPFFGGRIPLRLIAVFQYLELSPVSLTSLAVHVLGASSEPPSSPLGSTTKQNSGTQGADVIQPLSLVQ